MLSSTSKHSRVLKTYLPKKLPESLEKTQTLWFAICSRLLREAIFLSGMFMFNWWVLRRPRNTNGISLIWRRFGRIRIFLFSKLVDSLWIEMYVLLLNLFLYILISNSREITLPISSKLHSHPLQWFPELLHLLIQVNEAVRLLPRYYNWLLWSIASATLRIPWCSPIPSWGQLSTTTNKCSKSAGLLSLPTWRSNAIWR